MSAVSPFRLFGRPPEPEPALESGDGASWAPGAWDGEPRPATRHARPVAFGGAFGDAFGGARVDHDPPTDPHGFPPILAEPRAVPTARTPVSGMRRVAPARPAPDRLEAAQRAMKETLVGSATC